MLLKAFIDSSWLAVAVFAVIYISDYTLTIIGVRLYFGGANRHQTILGNYELTPFYQKDIEKQRLVSLRFILMLLASCFLLWISRFLFLPPPHPAVEIYEFLLGMFMLIQVPVHLRHIRNIISLSFMKRSLGLQGHLTTTQWLSYRKSAYDFLSFTVLFILGFVFIGHWFLLGGAFKCLVTAYRHWRLGQKLSPTIETENSTPIVTSEGTVPVETAQPE